MPCSGASCCARIPFANAIPNEVSYSRSKRKGEAFMPENKIAPKPKKISQRRSPASAVAAQFAEPPLSPAPSPPPRYCHCLSLAPPRKRVRPNPQPSLPLSPTTKTQSSKPPPAKSVATRATESYTFKGIPYARDHRRQSAFPAADKANSVDRRPQLHAIRLRLSAGSARAAGPTTKRPGCFPGTMAFQPKTACA